MDLNDSLDFYRSKLKHFFNKVDVQNRGYVTYEDITKGTVQRAQQYIEADSPLLKSYSEFLPKLWSMFYEPLAAEVDGETRVTLDAVLSVDLSSEDNRKGAQHAVDSFFDMADLNNDGHIDPNEFEWYLLFWGCTDKEDRKFAFETIDVNNDGLITREEFRNANLKYFCDHEDNEGKHFWGRFPEENELYKKKF